MTAAVEGLPMSVQVRLARHARAIGMDSNLVLARFAVERFLYRLSRSRHADRFVLKGALLMLVWLGETIRPTRDADLLGLGDMSEQSLAQIVTDVCNTEVEPDGLIPAVVDPSHADPAGGCLWRNASDASGAIGQSAPSRAGRCRYRRCRHA